MGRSRCRNGGEVKALTIMLSYLAGSTEPAVEVMPVALPLEKCHEIVAKGGSGGGEWKGRKVARVVIHCQPLEQVHADILRDSLH
jgi:hypothetical protein